MKNYLAMYEVPCYGRVPSVFEAENDEQAEEHAWKVSSSSEHFSSGNYELYRIDYDNHAHADILVPVVPEEVQA